MHELLRGPGRALGRDVLRRRRLPLAALAAGLVVAAAAPAAAERPAEVNARYVVSFAGVDIGWFQFNSKSNGARYDATGNAKVRLLFGAVKWTGTMSGSGVIEGGEVRPARYSQVFKSRRKLAFRSKKKTRTAELRFSGAKVATADVSPPRKTKGRVPLAPKHFRNVLDPLGALVSLTNPITGRDPCKRQVAIFDGRQRFALTLTPKRKVRLSGGTGHVCRVRYRPVAGHKADSKENRELAQGRSIEVTLRAVDGADILVPHEVSVPTRAGTAKLMARSVEVLTAGQQRIAFTN
ncbi:MAG: DUF3108 domain-containing protein [Pseudomonadota bacterium]